MTNYRAEDVTAVERWIIDSFEDGQNMGRIFSIREDGDLLYIMPPSGVEMQIDKTLAVVLAEDLLARYAAEVGTIIREP